MLARFEIRLGFARDVEHGIGGDGGDDDICFARGLRRISRSSHAGLTRAFGRGP
jgi:hypothetical protein